MMARYRINNSKETNGLHGAIQYWKQMTRIAIVRKNNNILVTLDYFFKWVEVYALLDQEAATIAEASQRFSYVPLESYSKYTLDRVAILNGTINEVRAKVIFDLQRDWH